MGQDNFECALNRIIDLKLFVCQGEVDGSQAHIIIGEHGRFVKVSGFQALVRLGALDRFAGDQPFPA